ncbi:hypothetical protein EMGBS15_14000 [Filimonas sp.]|nr:hypothetical protein EMGBS15_14000 [Filimonas sp.]
MKFEMGKFSTYLLSPFFTFLFMVSYNACNSNSVTQPITPN